MTVAAPLIAYFKEKLASAGDDQARYSFGDERIEDSVNLDARSMMLAGHDDVSTVWVVSTIERGRPRFLAAFASDIEAVEHQRRCVHGRRPLARLDWSDYAEQVG